MKQSEFIDALATQCQQDGHAITKADIARVLVALTGVVQAQLKSGEEVTLPGIGKFKVKQRAAKQGRNPKTGEVIEIPAKRAPAFTPAKLLKDLLG
jgi:DNA-binding protein HU-beta